ncbi:MAG: hypothetical protein KDC87_05680 [Planctomycetes bacterium]|nr:hypothetical protein [Planctomycetota bacterium]
MSKPLDREAVIIDRRASPDWVMFRESRPGPESDLIERFLSYLPVVCAPDSKISVLREPGLEMGFPDLVIVVWRANRASEWPETRMDLVPDDLRTLHYLHQTRSAHDDSLAQVFGKRRARSSLDRLLAAGLVRQAGRTWLPNARHRTFAATKIIAVEAKLGNWSRVLEQARRNLWFASKSYVLVPRASEDQLGQAATHGIGVVTVNESGITERPAQSRDLPRSYASWVINDLAWRASRTTDESAGSA